MGLSDAMRVGLTGLGAASAGLEAAQNNVANVNTPGYARIRPMFEEVVLGGGANAVPGGVRVTGYRSMRSEVLDARVASAESGLSSADSALRYLSQIEETVAPGGVSAIGERLDAFNAALTQLSARPEDPTLRAAVLGAADSLASKVRQVSSSVVTLQAEGQRELTVQAGRANQLSAGIAAVNRQLENVGSETAARSALIDRRTTLVNELAQQVDIRSYSDEGGRLNVTLSDGRALVSAGESYDLQVDGAPGGGVSLRGQDVTRAISGGAMGGVIAARDAAIVPTLMQLDAVASSIASTINTQHRQGFDGNGAAGGDVFVTGTGTAPGSQARGFSLVLTGGDQIAAAAQPGAPGDGTNATALARSTSTLSASVGQLTYQTGAQARLALDARGDAEALRTQAVGAREQLSGVNLDEEAVDMLRYQRSYQASARFLQTVNDLLGELINSI